MTDNIILNENEENKPKNQRLWELALISVYENGQPMIAVENCYFPKKD